ncbi:transposase [Streptomyces sp. NPDC056056]|uniref:transposase n=1 Tax=Streptomyces sp. NPDC056056 TaxID=3345698 RepID=UPI0035DE9D64
MGLGRSRGGLTSKLHLACDGRGGPLAVLVTGGNRDDCSQAEAVISLIRVSGPGPGQTPHPARPRRRRQGLLRPPFRSYLRRRGTRTTTPERLNQLAGRQRRRARPCGFNEAAYQRRNIVERCFHRLKQWRGIATRSDNRPDRCLSAITLASTLIWLDQ